MGLGGSHMADPWSRGAITMKVRNIALDLLGVAVLLSKPHYSGPAEELVHAYAGNVSVSFAMYFVAMLVMPQSARGRAGAGLVVGIAVTLFEITDGFGVMANVYDAWDLLANIVGICLAVVADVVTARWMDRSVRPGAASA